MRRGREGVEGGGGGEGDLCEVTNIADKSFYCFFLHTCSPAQHFFLTCIKRTLHLLLDNKHLIHKLKSHFVFEKLK